MKTIELKTLSLKKNAFCLFQLTLIFAPTWKFFCTFHLTVIYTGNLTETEGPNFETAVLEYQGRGLGDCATF